MFFSFFFAMAVNAVANVHMTVLSMVEFAAFAAPVFMTFKTMMKTA